MIASATRDAAEAQRGRGRPPVTISPAPTISASAMIPIAAPDNVLQTMIDVRTRTTDGRALRLDLDWRAVGDRAPDFVDFLIGERDAAFRPIEVAVRRTDLLEPAR